MLNKKEKDYAKKTKITQKTLLSIKKNLDCEEWINEFETNPYQLINFKGFGFKRCDELASKINFDMKSPLRIKAYIVVAIEDYTKGDSILDLMKVVKKMERDLRVPAMLIIQSIFSYEGEYVLLDFNHKSLTKNDVEQGNLPVYITKTQWYQAEKFVFNYLKKISKIKKSDVDYNIIERIIEKNPTINEKQKNIIENILLKNVNLIIGSAGSGKTYVTKLVLDLLDWHKYSYTLLTPTGIASFNLSEKVQRPSSTIHRKYFKKESITTDYLIIDEVGMCGYSHFNMLKEMIDCNNVKIIFIGDKYQLPSISAGDFLASITNLINKNKIDGNIFELTQVMRASSDKDITTVCNLFCGNNRFDGGVMSAPLSGVFFYDRQVDLFSQIEKIINSNNWNWNETAVIMPQRKGDYGCDNFNKYIQLKNTNDALYQDKFKLFKKHDILMHIKNNTDLNIYNGEMVELIDVIKGSYLARKLYDGTDVLYSEDELLTETTLGYSFTVHKSQGCTIKNVIFVGIQEFSFMLSRNLMYVGMSRASENLVVICDKDVILKSSYKNLTDKRKTFLNLLCGA